MGRVVVSCLEDLAPRMGDTGRPDDPAFASRAHGLVARVAVGHEAACEAVEEQLRTVPVTTHGEVEHVDRPRDAAIHPHPRGDAATRLLARIRDHLAGAGILRIVGISRCQ